MMFKFTRQDRVELLLKNILVYPVLFIHTNNCLKDSFETS